AAHGGLFPVKPPHHLPDKTQPRGGGLRVGRVVSEIRHGLDDGAPWGGNQAPLSSALAQCDECRIQQDMAEMLTVKLAKKEKENELFRLQQKSLDETRLSFEAQQKQLHDEYAATTTELTLANQQLQRQLKLLQSQYERIKEEGEARNVAAQEQRRLREKDQLQHRALNKERQCVIEQLTRDVRQSDADYQALENRFATALSDQEALSERITELKASNHQLEVARCDEQALRQQVESDLASCTQNLADEQRKRVASDKQLHRLEQEKLALEEKYRALAKSVKDANAKVVDADRKRLKSTKCEDQLAAQIVQLKKENDELKARKGQLGSQTKHLNGKIAGLEKTSETLQIKLNDALDELESARKCCREYQFRIKQLQEEFVFLEKRKQKAEPIGPAAAMLGASPEAPVKITALPSKAADSQVDSGSADIPCWMKDG
uniref:Uncharacterized protein n=1 Tax=Globisporangium ultimum (strain ATCC 200006 / CBS 805.95 / DAOM BR144) TaxID=431595 RepID=K3WV46_GLOUD